MLGVDLFYVPSNLQTLTDVWSSIISGAISELRLPSFHTLLQLFGIFYIDSMLFPVEFIIVTIVTPKNLFMKVIHLVLLLFTVPLFSYWELDLHPGAEHQQTVSLVPVLSPEGLHVWLLSCVN